MEVNPDAAFDPIVRQIILGGASVTGPDAFAGQYRLAELVADRPQRGMASTY